jgi:hypothetical protein
MLGMLGFAPAPKYITETPMEGKIASTFRKYHEVVTPYERALYSKELAELHRLRNEGEEEAYNKKLNQIQDKYNLSDSQTSRIEKNMDVPQTVKMFKQLTADQQLRLIAEMSPQERELYVQYAKKAVQSQLEEQQ